MKLDPDLRRAGALFALLTLWFLYPLWTDLGGLLHENGDSRLNAWIMAWDAHALIASPASLFDANAFHPYRNALALSENLLGSAILVAPLNWLGAPILAYNLVLLAAFFLTGILTWAWVLRITGSRAAALVTAVVWTFAPTRLDHLPHIQLLTAWWIPAALLAFEHWLETRQRRYAIAAGALYGWQYLAGIQLALFFAPLVALWVLIRLVRRPDGPASDPRRCAVDILAAGAVAALLVVPVSLPYLDINDVHGMERTIADVQPAPMRSPLAPSWMNRVGYMQRLQQRYGTNEANHFPGFVAALLLAAALGGVGLRFASRVADAARGRRTPRARFHLAATAVAAGALLVLLGGAMISNVAGRAPWADPFFALAGWMQPALLFPIAGLAALLTRDPASRGDHEELVAIGLYLAGVAYLLTLGPVVGDGERAYGTGPHGWLHTVAFPYRSIRALGRFGLPMFFFGSLAVGLAAHDLLRRFEPARARRVALWVLLALFAWELRTAPIYTEVARDDSWVYDRLRELPGSGAVMHLPGMPPPNPAAATVYMLGSTRHWRPLVNGYSGFLFPDSERLSRSRDIDSDTLRRLRRDFTADYLVVHRSPPLSEATFEAFRDGTIGGPGLLTPIDVREDAAIFRLRHDIDRGTYVYRRHSAARAAEIESVAFSARATAGSATLEIWWGSQLIGKHPLDESWRDIAADVPASWAPHADGTLTIAWRSVPERSHAVALGGGGAALLADVLVDAQHSGVAVAIDDRVRAASPPGALAAVLGHDGAAIESWRRFAVGRRGAARLRAFVEAVPPGRLVAVAATGASERDDLSALWEALRLVGSTLGAEAAPDRLAVLGTRGAPPGSALEQGSGGRAAVRAGPRTDVATSIQLRRIQLLPDEERGDNAGVDGERDVSGRR